MNDEQLVRRIESELGWPEGELRLDTRLDSLSRWDSMSVLMLISFIDAELGKTVTGLELRRCKTPLDLCRLIESAPSRN